MSRSGWSGLVSGPAGQRVIRLTAHHWNICLSSPMPVLCSEQLCGSSE